MVDQTRRQFLSATRRAGLGIAGAAVAWNASAHAQQSGANDRLGLAVIGVRGRGRHLLRDFAARDDCHITHICDVDRRIAEQRLTEVGDAQATPPAVVEDFRRAFDDPAVDAVVIATPDHWHALATIWACQAGKDVYVEKPISHSPWEGRQMVRAARKYDRVVQVGTQNRSAPYVYAAKEYLDSGQLGTIHLVRVFNQKHLPSISPQSESTPPEGLNWDMWSGPAPVTDYTENAHYRWNQFWRYSGGDIANDAVHQLDLARWLMNLDYPSSVYCVGGRFAELGESETPDTQLAVYEFPQLVMTCELTLFTPYMIKSDAALRNSDMFPHWPQNTERIEVYGTDGYMVLGRMGGGWQVFGRPKDRQPVTVAEAYGRFPDPEHQQNFVDSVRSRSRPNADIEDGHKSTLLCQYANISSRLGGRRLEIDGTDEIPQRDREALELWKRDYRAPYIVPEEV